MALLQSAEDLISNMPVDVTDEILKRLPLSDAAKMSVLSRKWRHNWLSHRYLYFDSKFWQSYKEKGLNGLEIGSKVVSSILLHHSGDIKTFHLDIYNDTALYFSQWLSFLSRTLVQNICLISYCSRRNAHGNMPSYVFHCHNLVKLRLVCFNLNPLPSEFEGFVHLRSLKLSWITFNHNILPSLISKCPRLVFLELRWCIGVTDPVIDVPSLEKIVLVGNSSQIQSVSLKNTPRLIDVSLTLYHYGYNYNQSIGAVNTIKSLANSCKLQYLEVGGSFFESLAAEGIGKPLPVKFNHLNRLCLTELELSDSDVVCCTIRMVQMCPCIRDLVISVNSSTDSTGNPELEYDETYRLRSLLRIKITGIRGSSVELRLIEYLLSVSDILETIFFKCGLFEKLDATVELQVSRALMRFRRASAKAQLVCLDE